MKNGQILREVNKVEEGVQWAEVVKKKEARMGALRKQRMARNAQRLLNVDGDYSSDAGRQNAESVASSCPRPRHADHDSCEL